MIYPSELNPLLDAIRSMFEALIELDDNEMEALVACNSNYTKPLLHLVSNSVTVILIVDYRKFNCRLSKI